MSVETDTGVLIPPISTPDSSTHKISQSFADRVREDICFYCQNKGHWARDCPSKSLNKQMHHTNPNPNSAEIHCSDFPGLQCPCGSGTCIIRISLTPRNPNRKFYVCPAKAGSCDYFKWCDEVTMEEINSSPQFPYPNCDCGAGICHKRTEKSGRYAGRNYFICPIQKGQGACPFFQWQDTSLNGDEAESKCFNSPPPTLKNRLNSNLVEDGDFSIKRLKRMEFESPALDTPLYTPNSMAVTDTLKRNKVSLIESREDGEQSDISSLKQYNLLQDMSLENDGSVPYSATGQLVSMQTKSWCSMIDKAPKASLLTSPAEIHRRQTEFWRQISAAGATSFRDPTNQILGVHVQGWLGRLAFRPSRCLTIPAPKPFFCCVFPSFDFIFVPQDVDVFDNKCSTILPHSPTVAQSDISGRLSPPTPAQKAQLSSDVLFKPSGLKSPPKAIEGNIMTGSILEAFRQAAVHVQNGLLTLLESMDPQDHKTMVKEANSAFGALDRLAVDYRPFYERVREFIGCVSSLAGIEQSIHNDTSQEIIDRYNCERLRSDDLSRSYAETADAFAASMACLQQLHEEATSVKNKLIQIENQLSSCEAKAMDLETRLVHIWKEMSESKQSLQAASQEADEAQKLRELREAERRGAKEALEKARLQLRQ